MDFFEAVKRRRSIRNYSATPVPAEVMHKALEAALLSPNSSNMQLWQIYWVQNPEKKRALAKACMNQGAARTAPELVVFTANRYLWKRNRKFLIDSLAGNPRQDLHDYYGKLIPTLYGWSILAPLKWVAVRIAGLFRPSIYEVSTPRDIQEVVVKSTALACQTFMLAIAAQGLDTCPMEGFDSKRVRRILGLKNGERIVMVISVGERTERGLWGERFRIPQDQVLHIIK